MTSALQFIQHWYASHCDGEWEHSYGIEIETLDNPGWSIEIALTGTELAGKQFDEVSIDHGEGDWLKCWIAQGFFKIACSPCNLTRSLELFEAWAKDGQRKSPSSLP